MNRLVEITLDKPRKLMLGINSIAEFEQATGISTLVILDDPTKLGFFVLRALFWAGLKWEERGLTIDRTGQIMQTYMENGGELKELIEAGLKALGVSGALGIAKQMEEGQPGEG